MRANEQSTDSKRSTDSKQPARTATRATAHDAPAGLLALQAGAGNAAVVQMLRRSGHDWAQPEQHRHGAGCGHGQAEQPAVQRSAVHDVLRTGGRPLDDTTRTDMETRLGADFSDVRIHDDSAARASAAEVGARAYTSGSHVVIGDGGGDGHTLAHELTHVIQQRQGAVAGTDNGSGLKVSDPSDRFEREAEANATRVMSGGAGPDHDVVAQRAVTPAGRTQDAVIQRAPVVHAQGEHIFNGFDSLTLEAGGTLVERVRARIELIVANKQKLTVSQSVGTWNLDVQMGELAKSVALAKALRDNTRFRSASSGEPLNDAGEDPNSIRYGQFAGTVRAALATCGTPTWDNGAALEALRADLITSITDQVARGVKRDTDLQNESARTQFDTWYRNTTESMETLFTLITATAKEIHPVLLSTARPAFGFEPGDEMGDEYYSM
ncbi:MULTISPECIES: DUF4157 domain-containing protein [Streptomyces]|uniref:eCIS core domain-containing protein n=1 Tax=Streptomyces TaxID=1883 RepID=UPI0004673D04|nr:DUF4157 domain-containing protein [Streptomyces exfoliatus]